MAADALMPTDIHDSAAQKRTVKVLASAQVMGGIGVASGAAVGALLAADLASDSFSGVASSASAVGAAFLAIPVSRIMDAKGRRPGLMFAYLVGMIGAALVVSGAVIGFFPLALMGMLAFGGGNAATLQSRYAATDLASPERRGRALAMVVWATTLGSVLGPNLSGPMGRVASAVGVPKLAGPYMLSVAVFASCMVLVATFLRPDPLLLARQLHEGKGPAVARKRMSISEALDIIMVRPAARIGLAAMMVGQAVMTSVMSMTPVHLKHHGHSIQLVGLVISIHIAGMYAFSPFVGMAVDRFGRRPVIVLGGAILLTSFVLAGTAPGDGTAQLSAGLMLLGLGWSCTMIAGSTLLSESIPAEVRPSVQGTADLMMGMSGAAAGLLAGLVVGLGSYALLTVLAACLVTPMIISTLRMKRQPALAV